MEFAVIHLLFGMVGGMVRLILSVIGFFIGHIICFDSILCGIIMSFYSDWERALRKVRENTENYEQSKGTEKEPLPQFKTDERSEITYQLVGEVYLPLLAVDKQESKPLGKWGRQRLYYLQQNDEVTYQILLADGTLMEHLHRIESTAKDRMRTMLPQYLNAAGVTEELKREDQMKWVGLYNNCKAEIEQIIFREVIYA